MGIQGENWIQRHQLTVEQYYQMAQVGLLSPDDRVELIEGEIIDMAPIGSEHAGIVTTLAEWFNDALRKRATVAVQNPVRLGERSEPEPDLAILHRRQDRYRSAHPTAADVYLIIEVGQTSARYDREVKLPLYAKHAIPEVWIIDTEKRELSIHRDPQGERYASQSRTTAPGKIKLAALPDVEVDLTGLF
jgi:Uma2 family endonuclease